MKIVPLNNTEAAATGFSHVINIKAADGDLNTAGETQNVMPVLAGFWVKDLAIDIRTAWNGLTSPTIAIGVTDSQVSDDSLLTATTLSSSGMYSGSSTGVVVNDASQYITITQGGAGTAATAGEANILLRLVDLRLGRVTFSN